MSLSGTIKILWRCDVNPVHPPLKQIFSAISGHPQKGIIGFHDLFPVCDDDSNNIRIYQGTRSLLALAQGFLSPFLLLDIGTDAKPVDDLPCGITYWERTSQKPAIGPCLTIPEPIFILIGGPYF